MWNQGKQFIAAMSNQEREEFEALVNRGNRRTHAGDMTGAEAACKQAIALGPDAAVAWSNLGGLYACMKREAESKQRNRTTIALDEAYAMARYNLGNLLSRQAKFEQGRTCLEARNCND